MWSQEPRFKGVELINKRPVQFDVKQHTVPSVGRVVNCVPWTHKTGKRVSVFVHSAAVFYIGPVSDDFQRPQDGECNLQQ